MTKIEIADIIGTNQTKAFQEQSTLLDRKLIAHLKNNQGKFEIPKFKRNDFCWDVSTYTHAVSCIVEDTWEENGHNKYLISTAGHKSIVRECDLILRKGD